MGFVADISRCTLDIESRPEILNALKPDIRPISNEAVFPMHSFKAHFWFKFEAQQGSANQTGSARIGLVQNVLYERRTFKYADGPTKTVAWESDIVDSGSKTAFPFYNEPGDVRRAGKTEHIVPFRRISYNQRGFGEQGGNTMGDTSADVSLIDQPWFKLKVRNKHGALLTEATQILTFGIWLVVLSDQQPPQVLAHTETFSLMFACKLTRVGTESTISVPSSGFKVRASKGTAHSTTNFPRAGGVRAVSGKSKKGPVLEADSKDTRDETWKKLYLSL
ncbi:MAG TPA: hypothetical protein VJV78_49785 [Polyangiales bacterium]|nr:hypothetical protein [Polyangiales bacterium]